MERDQEPRNDHGQNDRDARRASTAADQKPAIASEVAPSQNAIDARNDAQSVTAPSETKPIEAPQLNKWQTFWRGVLHVDKTKMQPWIALRNARGVAIPLAGRTAIAIPRGG